ncbi:MAG: hypothetical protein AB1697_02640 [Pseudomonadota bacterium]
MDAWEIRFALPVSRAEALRCFPPLDTWLRLNPQWSVLALKPAPEAGRYALQVRDEASETEIAYRADFSQDAASGIWRLDLADAQDTRRIEVYLDETAAGTQLVYREAGVPADARATRTNLALWHRSTLDYLLLTSRRDLRARLMKFLLDRVWLRMSQPGRRIAFMIIASEIAALALLLLWLAWMALFE